MGQLDHRATARRRWRRGFLSAGWIHFILEPLERRYLMSVNPAGESHQPRNPDGSADASDGLIGFATRINEDNNKTFSDEVASFTDDQNGSPADFAATIDWGDGVSDAGSIVANSKGGLDVVGTHNYSFGWHGIKITVNDLRDASRASEIESLAYVIPPPVAARGATIDAVAGHVFDGLVATFVGVDTDKIDKYVTNIYWGEGESSQGTLKVVGDGVVQLIGQHSFIKPGEYDIQASISENVGSPPFYLKSPEPTSGMVSWSLVSYFGGTQEARSRANVAPGEVDGDLLKLDLTDGLPFNDAIAHFSSGSDLAHYSALVETSDSTTPIAGVITASGDGFDVSINHTFLNNWQNITVRLSDDRITAGGNQVGIATGSLDIRSHLSADVRSFTVVTGEEYHGRVGSISTVGGENWESKFTATIDWGDGSESEGEVVANASGGYDVIGTHTYGIENFQHHVGIGINVIEKRTPKNSGVGSDPEESATSAYGNMYDGGVTLLPARADVFALEEQPPWLASAGEEDSTIAILTAADPSAFAATFTGGTVTWGDGSTSSAGISDRGDGTFDVFARAPAEGSYTGHLTITAGGVTRQLDVSLYFRPRLDPTPGPPAFADVEASDIKATKGVEWSGIVARFHLLDDSDAGSDLTAQINWGEGDDSDGTITRDADGTYVVHGSHTYDSETTDDDYYRSVTVTVSKGEKTSWGFADYSVSIDPARINADGEYGNARQLEEFTATLAKFTSPLKGATFDQYTATIDWGDGTSSAGAITAGYKRHFEISGTHTYRADGSFTPTITITGPGGSTVTHASMYVEHHPVEVLPGPAPQSDGFTVGGVMATFIDTDGASDDPDSHRVYHADLIDWGDGTITQGAIGANGDGFDVSGSHTYASAGDYAVKVIVRRNDRYLPSSYPIMWMEDRGGMDYASSQAAPISLGGSNDDFESPTMMVHVGVGVTREDGTDPVAKATSPRPSELGSLFGFSAHRGDSVLARVEAKTRDFGDVEDDALLGLS